MSTADDRVALRGRLRHNRVVPATSTVGGQKMKLRAVLIALRAQRLRSALTMLGLVIGVTSVILLVPSATECKNRSTRALSRWPI